MSKKNKKNPSSVKTASADSPTRKNTSVGKSPVAKPGIDLPLVGLSLAGAVLAGYITFTKIGGSSLAFCDAGSSCDLVQSSRWGAFLGLPISLWGMVLYGAMAWVGWRMKPGPTRWKLHWAGATLGLAYSLYLTSISVWEIQAACFYCLGSLGLMAALFGLAIVRRPRDLPGFSVKSWLAETGLLAVILVGLMHLHYSGVFDPAVGPEDPYLQNLAVHLSREGVVFYGASWCPHCQDQKKAFGASAHRLPYVECSPGGPQAPKAPECVANHVTGYPTWHIGGQVVTGFVSPGRLAELSGFHYTPPAPPALDATPQHPAENP
ncbi:MAG: vitamin K epoxide reductase family protein [Deltaproteobacteria bacterium]|nr:vitamin K epoxide reductase family protein [Deltaproteobacteria bacterium]